MIFPAKSVAVLLAVLLSLTLAAPSFAGQKWLESLQSEKEKQEAIDNEIENRWIFTFYRSPSTGLEYKFSDWAAHLGWYPVRLRNSEDGLNQVVFFKMGIKHYLNPVDSAPFFSLFYGISGDDAWSNPFGVEVGYRFSMWRRFDIRLGFSALFFADHRPTFDPTLGFGVFL